MADPSILTDPNVARLFPYVVAIFIFIVLAVGGVVFMTVRFYQWFKKTIVLQAQETALGTIREIKTTVTSLAHDFQSHISEERQRFAAFESMVSNFTNMQRDMADVRERLGRIEEKIQRMEEERKLRHDRDVRELLRNGE